jgi:hypothetical protein
MGTYPRIDHFRLLKDYFPHTSRPNDAPSAHRKPDGERRIRARSRESYSVLGACRRVANHTLSRLLATDGETNVAARPLCDLVLIEFVRVARACRAIVPAPRDTVCRSPGFADSVFLQSAHNAPPTLRVNAPSHGTWGDYKAHASECPACNERQASASDRDRSASIDPCRVIHGPGRPARRRPRCLRWSRSPREPVHAHALQ